MVQIPLVKATLLLVALTRVAMGESKICLSTACECYYEGSDGLVRCAKQVTGTTDHCGCADSGAYKDLRYSIFDHTECISLTDYGDRLKCSDIH